MRLIRQGALRLYSLPFNIKMNETETHFCRRRRRRWTALNRCLPVIYRRRSFREGGTKFRPTSRNFKSYTIELGILFLPQQRQLRLVFAVAFN
jgi:hypothetical protein